MRLDIKGDPVMIAIVLFQYHNKMLLFNSVFVTCCQIMLNLTIWNFNYNK